MILFCLPYAGGSEAMYYSWKKYLDPAIELVPVALKGRGTRLNENLYNSIEEAISDVYFNVKDKINNDYAIFGHSMGSMLAFELYYRICEEGLRKPCYIFFSGDTPPSSKKPRKTLHTLPDTEFMQEIINLGGTPPELLENSELLQLVLPVLRSDVRISEEYIYKRRTSKIDCNIAIFSGKDDQLSLQDLLLWKHHGDKGFKTYCFEGAHFFINDNAKEIISVINKLLLG